MKASTPISRPKAYSYLRFSTPEQMKGDSFRRQTELAKDYAEKHDLDLDTKLTFHDLGVSAFRGANAVVGALAEFKKAVDSGRVEKGSYLLIENLDRLSRDQIHQANRRFEDLLEGGVNIVTLTDGKVYTPQSLNNLLDRILSLVTMSRAHDESDMKSRRLKAAWVNKRDKAVSEGLKLTARAPAWLKLNHASNSFEPIKARVAIVKRIFAEAREGYGRFSIASRLNEDRVPTFGRADGWYPSYVEKILRNEAVIGRYQPMRRTYENGKVVRIADGAALVNYFPVIISEADFYRIQGTRPAATGKKGKPLANLLSGLVFCSVCGGKAHWVNKGNGNSYLSCDRARRLHKCEAKSVRYGPVETALLNSLYNRDIPKDVGPTVTNLLHYAEMYAPKLTREKLAWAKEVAEANIAAEDRAIENLGETIANMGGNPALETQLLKHQERLRNLKKSHERFTRELREAESEDDVISEVRALAASWQEAGKLPKRERTAFFDHNYSRMNGVLKKLIAGIDVGPKEMAVRVRGIEKPAMMVYAE